MSIKKHGKRRGKSPRIAYEKRALLKSKNASDKLGFTSLLRNLGQQIGWSAEHRPLLTQPRFVASLRRHNNRPANQNSNDKLGFIGVLEKDGAGALPQTPRPFEKGRSKLSSRVSLNFASFWGQIILRMICQAQRPKPTKECEHSFGRFRLCAPRFFARVRRNSK